VTTHRQFHFLRRARPGGGACRAPSEYTGCVYRLILPAPHSPRRPAPRALGAPGRRFALALLLLAACLAGSARAQQPAPAGAPAGPGKIAALSAELHGLKLDPDACYEVRDVPLDQPDVHFYFTDGWLIFARPVAGQRIAAIYVAEEATDDAEVLIRPSNRSERGAMARSTGAPNLDEHFRLAVFLFTQGDGDTLLRTLDERGAKHSPERGLLLGAKFGDLARNIATSLEVRVLYDLLARSAERHEGLFFAGVAGNQHGNFDVYIDPLNYEQAMVGRMGTTNTAPEFEVWSSFRTRAAMRANTPLPEDARLDNYRIDATIQPNNLHLEAVTRVTLHATRRVEGVLALDISPRMHVTEARVDGAPVEIFRRESVREALRGGGRNETVLIALPASVERGAQREIEIHHNGDVIAPAAPGVFFVADRVNWYPSHGYAFSNYDLRFRLPKQYLLAAPGDPVEERVDGDWRIVHRRTAGPIRMAAFNIGNYERVTVTRGEYEVEMFSNASAEPAPHEKPAAVVMHSPATDEPMRNARSGVVQMAVKKAVPPAARMSAVGQDIAEEFEWMASKFGPPPLNRIAVSPIPGFFGQGFPGLIYLSTVTYLDDAARKELLHGNPTANAFYGSLMHAHETAHQWWGNLVIPATYHDDWISEALANYTAMLVLEQKSGGIKVVDLLLEDYRLALLRNAGKGTYESAGPITWGFRLQDGASADAWHLITYGKGSWILHMLRRRMGDDAFLRMLSILRKRYEYRTVSTEEFRVLASQFLPPHDPDPKLESFFDTWVYSTGVPTLEMTTATRGKAPNVTLTVTVKQSGVADDFTAEVPIEIRGGAGTRPLVRWVHTSSEPAVLTVNLKVSPQRVELAPRLGVLMNRPVK
jgi:hypothetical protein